MKSSKLRTNKKENRQKQRKPYQWIYLFSECVRVSHNLLWFPIFASNQHRRRVRMFHSAINYYLRCLYLPTPNRKMTRHTIQYITENKLLSNKREDSKFDMCVCVWYIYRIQESHLCMADEIWQLTALFIARSNWIIMIFFWPTVWTSIKFHLFIRWRHIWSICSWLVDWFNVLFCTRESLHFYPLPCDNNVCRGKVHSI